MTPTPESLRADARAYFADAVVLDGKHKPMLANELKAEAATLEHQAEQMEREDG